MVMGQQVTKEMARVQVVQVKGQEVQDPKVRTEATAQVVRAEMEARVEAAMKGRAEAEAPPTVRVSK